MADPYTTGKPESHPGIYPNVTEKEPTPTAPEPEVLDDKADENEKAAIGVNMYKDNEEDEKEDEIEEKEKKEIEKPLLDEDSVTIDMKPGKEGEDSATLPLPDRKKKSIEDSESQEEEKQREKLPVYLFPFSRLKNAWYDSSNVFQFLGTATCIIFQTVGWFTCVGGVPFLSLVMLIIGSIYKNDCKIQPNIPIYLIVSGTIGTIQHFLTLWTKYVPKDSKGRLHVYRRYCRALNGLLHIFLFIWFILGCIWVYGARDVNTKEENTDEYCHKTLYYFAFWIFNLSFILLGMLVALSLCFVVIIIATAE